MYCFMYFEIGDVPFEIDVDGLHYFMLFYLLIIKTMLCPFWTISSEDEFFRCADYVSFLSSAWYMLPWTAVENAASVALQTSVSNACLVKRRAFLFNKKGIQKQTYLTPGLEVLFPLKTIILTFSLIYCIFRKCIILIKKTLEVETYIIWL